MLEMKYFLIPIHEFSINNVNFLRKMYPDLADLYEQKLIYFEDKNSESLKKLEIINKKIEKKLKSKHLPSSIFLATKEEVNRLYKANKDVSIDLWVPLMSINITANLLDIHNYEISSMELIDKYISNMNRKSIKELKSSLPSFKEMVNEELNIKCKNKKKVITK